jgi:hypothetical protein
MPKPGHKNLKDFCNLTFTNVDESLSKRTQNYEEKTLNPMIPSNYSETWNIVVLISKF